MPTALPDVASDVATYLAAQGLGLTVGTNLFAAPETQIAPTVLPQTACVFVVASGGPAPAPYLSNHGSFHRLAFNVRVLGAKESWDAGADLARAIADKVHLASISGYVAVYLLNAQPVPALDDHDAPLWSINAEAQFVS